MNMLLPLSLCFALMMLTCCENQEEATTSDYDYVTETATATPDYDYNATFDYYYVTERFHSEGPDLHVDEAQSRSKTAGIGPFSFLLLLGLAVHQLWT